MRKISGVKTISSLHFQYYKWNLELDQGRMPEGLEAVLQEMGIVKQEESKSFLT